MSGRHQPCIWYHPLTQLPWFPPNPCPPRLSSSIAGVFSLSVVGRTRAERREKEREAVTECALLALPALYALVLVSMEALGLTSRLLIPSLFQLRAAWNLSDFPRARIHSCPATVLPWLRLNLVLWYWIKDEGGWTEVPFGIVGATAVDPQRPSNPRLLRFARSDSHSLRAWRREADLCEGMRIGK